MIIDSLIDAINRTKNPICVGLDTSIAVKPDGVSFLEFNKAVIDAVYDIVPAVKVQIAYYELQGIQGLIDFKETLLYAKSKGLITIADAKRNDIGPTATAYSSAFFGGEFDCDFLTVNGYLGTDGLEPFQRGKNWRNGMFVLVKTSNPSSNELQNLKLSDGRFVYEAMGDITANLGGGKIGKHGYSNVGAVVGATMKEEAASLRKRLPNTFFLVPGYGAQGATARDAAACFDSKGGGAIVNNSRGILTAWQKCSLPFDKAAREECLKMREEFSFLYS